VADPTVTWTDADEALYNELAAKATLPIADGGLVGDKVKEFLALNERRNKAGKVS
jgi:hypothetical protein